jgi:hypothetical protein
VRRKEEEAASVEEKKKKGPPAQLWPMKESGRDHVEPAKNLDPQACLHGWIAHLPAPAC